MEPLSKAWSKPWVIQETDPEFRIWHYFLRIGILVILFVAITRALQLSTRLSPESYQEPVIYLAFLENIITNWELLSVSVVVTIGSIFFRKNLGSSWNKLSCPKPARLLVMLAAVVLAWTFATYDFNLYFNQAHYADRILLLALIPLIYWRPVFVLPFLTVLFPVIRQFSVLAGYSWAATFIPLNMLILFSTFFTFYAITNFFLVKDFAFLTGCLFAASYWLSGYGKLTTDWLMHDKIYFLLPATYANGWLAGFDPDTMSSIVQSLTLFNVPLKFLVIGIEFGMLFFFYHHKLMRFLIYGTVLLHTGIFFVSGIFFWMWGAMSIGLLICFTRKDAFPTLPLYTKMHIITSMALIAGGVYWCNPPKLAWYDSPVSYTYRFKAITENAHTYYLSPGFFAPYEYQFTLSKFGYLSHQPSLQISWGATQNAEMAQKLTQLDLSQV